MQSASRFDEEAFRVGPAQAPLRHLRASENMGVTSNLNGGQIRPQAGSAGVCGGVENPSISGF